MATVTLRRSDLFPVGTTVGIYPGRSQRRASVSGPPTAAVIASAAVDGTGLLTVTDAAIASYTDYVAYALVGGEHRYARLRSTLDITDIGTATFTADTSSGSAALANASVSVGAIAIGQRVEGTGIPPGTFIISGSGASWTMSDKATANGTGVTLRGHGASPAVAGGANGAGGATLIPVNTSRWRARVMQRRAAAGTS